MKKKLPRDQLYDIIDVTKEDLNSDEVKEALMAIKRKQIENEHGFRIWQASDGRWKTYYQEPGKKRKLIACKEKSDLIDRLMQFKYENVENPTLESLFEEWLNEKLEFREITEQTASRYRQDFQRYFVKYNWHKKKVLNVDMDELTHYVKSTIVNEALTKKSFGNYRILIRGIFSRAKKRKFVDWNIRSLIDDMFISKKSFVSKKIDPEEQILNDEEVEKMMTYLWNHQDMMNMAILLDFYTGLRIGELVSLKKSDFVDGEYLHIQRTEIAIHGRCNEGDNLSSTAISEQTKTENGDRMVFLSKEAIKIVEWLLDYPNNDTEWMFVSKNQNRIVRATLHRRLTQICEKIGIPHRSMHKIRKTYASRLLDSGVNDNLVIKQMGHSNIEVTKNYYYFTHQMRDEQQEQISKAMSDYKRNSNQKQSKSESPFKLVTRDFKRVSSIS